MNKTMLQVFVIVLIAGICMAIGTTVISDPPLFLVIPGVVGIGAAVVVIMEKTGVEEKELRSLLLEVLIPAGFGIWIGLSIPDFEDYHAKWPVLFATNMVSILIIVAARNWKFKDGRGAKILLIAVCFVSGFIYGHGLRTPSLLQETSTIYTW